MLNTFFHKKLLICNPVFNENAKFCEFNLIKSFN